MVLEKSFCTLVKIGCWDTAYSISIFIEKKKAFQINIDMRHSISKKFFKKPNKTKKRINAVKINNLTAIYYFLIQYS